MTCGGRYWDRTSDPLGVNRRRSGHWRTSQAADSWFQAQAGFGGQRRCCTFVLHRGSQPVEHWRRRFTRPGPASRRRPASRRADKLCRTCVHAIGRPRRASAGESHQRRRFPEDRGGRSALTGSRAGSPGRRTSPASIQSACSAPHGSVQRISTSVRVHARACDCSSLVCPPCQRMVAITGMGSRAVVTGPVGTVRRMRGTAGTRTSTRSERRLDPLTTIPQRVDICSIGLSSRGGPNVGPGARSFSR